VAPQAIAPYNLWFISFSDVAETQLMQCSKKPFYRVPADLCFQIYFLGYVFFLPISLKTDMKQLACKKRFNFGSNFLDFRSASIFKMILLFGIILTANPPLLSQYLIHRTITTADGLPSDYVNHFSQDKDGYIWISTDKGACRFDGKNFQTFTVDNGLPNNFITSAYQDINGDMWFGSFSNRPLSRKAGDSISHFQIQNKGPRQVFFDSRNRTYLCDLNKFICLQQALPLPEVKNFHIQAVQISKDSFLVQYPDKFYLLDVSGKTVKILTTPKADDISGRMHIFNNTIFIVGNMVAATIDTRKPWPWNIEVLQYGNFSSMCSIITDSSIIMGHYKGLFEYSLHNGHRVSINNKFDLPEIGINCIFRDKQGSLWIATHGKGIIICPKRPVFITEYEDDRIVGIASDKKEIGVITVSGLFTWRPDYLKPLGKDIIYQQSGLYFCRGNWWLSDYQFLYGPAKNLRDIYSLPSINISNGISSFLIDKNNIEYIGTYADGIIRRKYGKILDTLNLDKGLCSNTIEKVISIPSGIAALTYSNGFNIIGRNDTIFHFDKAKGLLSNTIYTIGEVKDTLLVGTEKGFSVLVKGKNAGAAVLDPATTGNRVLAFFNDQSGRQFLITDKCLCIREGVKIKPIRSQKILSREREIITTGFYQSENDMLFLGTSRGLAYLPMPMVKPDSNVTEPTLEKVIIGQKDFSQNHQALIKGAENRITFSFVAQTFLIGQTPQIHFRLNGFDTGYRVLTGNYSVMYQNLPPGKYQLEALSVNGDGYPSKKLTLFQLDVRPHWWESSFFRIVSIILVAFLTAWVVWQFLQKRYQNKLAILKMKEEQHAQRDRIRRDLHDNIGSQLSYIATQLDWLEQNTNHFSKEKMEESLNILGESTRQIVTDLRESMWSMKFDMITVELLSQRIQQIVQKQQSYNRGPAIHFHNEAPGQLPISPHNALNLLRICQEAIHNAMKHAQASSIEISLSGISENAIRLKISDDGIGFDTKGKELNEKYGLENMERRADESGIMLKILSIPGQGTTITAEIYLQQ
jgi:signal transduction histidine kinase